MPGLGDLSDSSFIQLKVFWRGKRPPIYPAFRKLLCTQPEHGKVGTVGKPYLAIFCADDDPNPDSVHQISESFLALAKIIFDSLLLAKVEDDRQQCLVFQRDCPDKNGYSLP